MGERMTEQQLRAWARGFDYDALVDEVARLHGLLREARETLETHAAHVMRPCCTPASLGTWTCRDASPHRHPEVEALLARLQGAAP
jgi:hypothetical protein